MTRPCCFNPSFPGGKRRFWKDQQIRNGMTLIQQIHPLTLLFRQKRITFQTFFRTKILMWHLKKLGPNFTPLVTDLSRISRFYNQSIKSIKFTQRPTAAKDCFTKSFCLSCGEKLKNELDDETLKFGDFFAKNAWNHYLGFLFGANLCNSTGSPWIGWQLWLRLSVKK